MINGKCLIIALAISYMVRVFLSLMFFLSPAEAIGWLEESVVGGALSTVQLVVAYVVYHRLTRKDYEAQR